MEWTCCYFLFLTSFVSVTCKDSSSPAESPENYSNYPCTDQNHIFLTPGVLTSGTNSRVCLSRFYTDGPAWLTLTLTTSNLPAVTTVKELASGDGGCADIPVPQLPNTPAHLVVQVSYPGHCKWERRIKVRISSGRLLFLQTEKTRFRPGEVVRLRVLALRAALTPGHTPIDEVWLTGPPAAGDSRMAQWRRVRTRLGLTQLQHKLDPQAPHGKWSVKARLADGTQGSADFWVGDYELPPFQLTVRHAPTVLRTSERLVWTVCVRYPWSEAVEGMLVIRLLGVGGSESSGGIRTAVQLRAPRACHRHAAAAKRISLDSADPPHVILALFSFQEAGTRIWQNTTVVSQVVDNPVDLEFLSKHRTVIAPGLPYKLKVKATTWEGKPAANELIRVCRSPTDTPSGHSEKSLNEAENLLNIHESRSTAKPRFKSHIPDKIKKPEINTSDLLLKQTETFLTSEDLKGKLVYSETEQNPPGLLVDESNALKNTICDDAMTDNRGVARILFTTRSDEHFAFYRFQATLHNNTAITTAPLFLPVKRSGVTHVAFGPLTGDSRAPGSRVFVPLYLSMKDVRRSITVHFVVVTRGGIIYRWGATNQCPVSTSANEVRTASRNSECEDENYQRDASQNQDGGQIFQNGGTGFQNGRSDALSDRNLLRFMLPVRVTHQMCPDSHLVAYFYYNGELVSASKHIEVEECFANKVDITWLTRQTAPGSSATLYLTTPGNSLCALSALDSAAKWALEAGRGVKETVMDELKRLVGGNRNMTAFDEMGGCFDEKDNLPSSTIDLTSSWLAAAGVRLVGGGFNDRKRCQGSAPAPLIEAEDTAAPRTDFSEAWLWRLVTVNSNGSAVVTSKVPDSITRYEASALCVAKNGISVSHPAVLQVFREFFIHADAPKRLRRGDASIVQYRIFNYLYEPLSVQIQILTSPHLDLTSPQSELVCLGPRASIARRAELRARIAGAARVSVRATAQPDTRCGNYSGGVSRVSDEVILQLNIDHEGVPIQDHRSTLLCAKGSSDSSKSEVTWTWPQVDMVPGTEALTVWAVGDINGPLLTDADALVTLPRGCGEQNMARLATNLLALRQLDPMSATAATAKDHVERGYIRQLQYSHPSGGFSAFGPADGVPSTWLTAFTVRYLRRAHQVLYPGAAVPNFLERAESWLISQQMENGCFRNEGQVFHRELKGGLGDDGSGNVALTAYVITSLVDGDVTLPTRVLRNSLACLRALPPPKRMTPTRMYSHALLAYTFARLQRYELDSHQRNDASLLRARHEGGAGLQRDEDLRELMKLLEVARRHGELVSWETGSLPTSIEATGYALLAMSYCHESLRDTICANDARGAIRWLSTHRNAAGGFLSTQDTLVALEAITTWSSVHPSSPAHLKVISISDGSRQTVSLVPETARVPAVMTVRAGDETRIVVEGTGCALVQATRSYNTHTPENQATDSILSVQVSVHTDGPFNCDGNSTFCFCAAIVEACVVWNGQFPEMALMEVLLPGGFGADASLLYGQLDQPYTLLRRIEMSQNGGRVTLYLGTKDGSDSTTGLAGHQCYSLHAVGARTRTKPAYARVMDYYRPQVNDTQIYTIPEDCPTRISHDKKPKISWDNLYGSARSMSQDGGIIITDEYSFEDIPEGIPLDDPLFDNLSQADNIVGKTDDKENHESNSTKDENDRTSNYTKRLTFKNSSELQKTKFEDKELYIPNNDTNEGAKHKTQEENEILLKPIDLKITNDGTNYILDENIVDSTKSIEQKRDTFSQSSDTGTIDNSRIANEPTQQSDTVDGNSKLNKEQPSQLAPSEEFYNPKLSHFHVIDSEKDLDVPTGLEGPIPAIVLPPQNFVSVPEDFPPVTSVPLPSRDILPPKMSRDFQNTFFLRHPPNMHYRRNYYNPYVLPNVY